MGPLTNATRANLTIDFFPLLFALGNCLFADKTDVRSHVESYNVIFFLFHLLRDAPLPHRGTSFLRFESLSRSAWGPFSFVSGGIIPRLRFPLLRSHPPIFKISQPTRIAFFPLPPPQEGRLFFPFLCRSLPPNGSSVLPFAFPRQVAMIGMFVQYFSLVVRYPFIVTVLVYDERVFLFLPLLFFLAIRAQHFAVKGWVPSSNTSSAVTPLPPSTCWRASAGEWSPLVI